MSGPPRAVDPRRFAVVATGDELVDGATVDRNSSTLARRLGELGLEAERFVVLGDDLEALAELYVELAARTGFVVSTGGLGPTLDDLTREAAARAAGRPLVESPAARAHLEEWFERAGVAMPAANLRQALVPEGAELLRNRAGTAPGFRCAVGGRDLFVLPGPPREMEVVLEEELVPRLVARLAGGPPACARFHLFGLPESLFAEHAGAWMERAADPRMGVSAKGGRLSVTLRARGADRAVAEAALAARCAAFRERFAEHVYSEDEPDLARVLGALLLGRGLSVATAESCTGGLVAAALTAVPGISAVFREGFVTYSNDAKRERLGVPAALLDAHGAVSGPVAEAMARGAAERAGARLAVSVTGVAGPGGGSPEKPVGLVWFGVALDGRVTAVERRTRVRGREAIRAWATAAALDLARRAVLTGSPPLPAPDRGN